MKQIVVHRSYQNFSMWNFKVFIDDNLAFELRNGETKTIHVDKIPANLWVKLGWFKSHKVIIDEVTNEVTIKNEKSKNLIAPLIGALLMISIRIPENIWGDSIITMTISILSISLILAWTFYAFILKKKDWIIIDKITREVKNNAPQQKL